MPVSQLESSPGNYVNAKAAVDGNLFVNSQLTTLAASLRGLAAQVTPYGTLKVSGEASTLFNDTFEGALDTTNRWTASGTAAPTSANGALTLNGGTTNSATSILVSKPTFVPTVGFTLIGLTMQFDAAKVANPNMNIAIGFAAVSAPTAAAPIDDGYVWERDITGELCCSIYVGGVRYVANSTNPALITAQGSLPSGAFTSTYSNPISWPAGTHTLVVAQRGDLAFWFLDTFDVPVAVAKYVTPNVQTLPVRIAKINAASAVVATLNTIGAILVADSASQNQSLSDATYPWRRLNIAANGGAQVEQKFSYSHISTSTTTNVAAVPGLLHAISVNTKGTVASTITVYDSLTGSGAVIGVIDSLNLSGAFVLDVAFTIGLTIVTTGTVAPDLTVSYR